MPGNKKKAVMKVMIVDPRMGGSWWSDVTHGRFGQALGKTISGIKKGIKDSKVVSSTLKNVPLVGEALSNVASQKGYGRGRRGGNAVKF
jgi:hypothetical protein